MQISTDDNTGTVILHPLGNAEPRQGVTIREVTPDLRAVLDQGGPFQWVPNDPDYPQGTGALTRTVPAISTAILRRQLAALWDAVPREGMTGSERSALRIAKAAVLDALEDGDLDDVRAIIATTPLPSALEPLRAQWLDALPAA